MLRRGVVGWLVARWLDAAQRAAQFLDFALVGELLALGNFDEFENFVELINRVLERLGNLGGVRDGLADGRGFRRTKIRRLDPRFRTLRLGPALFVPRFGAALAFRLGRRGNFGHGFSRCFRGGFTRRLGNFFGRGGFAGFFGMRFAEIAGGVGFRFRNAGVRVGFFRRLRRRRRFRDGGGGLFNGRTRTAATATATAPAATGGAAGGGGQIQIGMFVRHKFSLEDGGFARKCNGEVRLLFHKRDTRWQFDFSGGVMNFRYTQMAKSVYSGVAASVGAANMPAATVEFVPCSIKINEPVSRLVL